MFSKLGTVVLCLFVYAAKGCGPHAAGGAGQPAPRPTAASATPGGGAAGAQTAADAAKSEAAGACALVESAEVEAVQGGKVSAARPVSLTRGPLAVTQCHYQVSAPDKPGQNLGVLVEVRRAGSDARALAEEWRKLRDKKENKRSERPRPVEGLGDEAFWVGSEKLGALYVRKGDRLVYVSVGGPADSGSKLEKSKRLAAKALARM